PNAEQDRDVRLFAAVRPAGPALDHLESALAAVGPGHGQLRWTVRENWHVTLAFYGEVPEGAVDELAAGLERLTADSPSPRLVLRGAGVFSGRTLWVGTGGELAELVALCHGAREVGAEVLGRAEERERVRPHLTVGRQLPSGRQSARRGRVRGEA